MVGQSPQARRYGIFRVGQRRRLNRQSSLSRSTTTPYLRSMVAAAAAADSETTASAVARGPIGAGLGLVQAATPTSTSHSAMDLNTSQQSDDPFTCRQPVSPCSPTTAALPTATFQGRKKFGLFPLKSTKDNDRSESSYDLGLSSPLPPLTPSKAKQLLGLDANDARLSGEKLDSPSRPVRLVSLRRCFWCR